MYNLLLYLHKQASFPTIVANNGYRSQCNLRWLTVAKETFAIMNVVPLD